MKKILCIDDIKTNLFTLQSVIESYDEDSYTIFLAESANEGLNILLKEDIDIILLDVMMPEIDGFECATLIRSNRKTKLIPIIFVTANHDDETIENCFNTGLSDYIKKPYNHIEMMARIDFHLKLFQREKESRERAKFLEYDANHDILTKIYNRKKFDSSVKEKLTNDIKNLQLILLDIDYFKRVNDDFGHLVGDEVLKSITELIESYLDENNIFARWGGEEFIITVEKSLDEAVALAEKLREAIEREEFDVVKNLTCSFGVTKLEFNDSLESMIKRADNALYKAKEEGRNRVCKEI
jgi:diguanylate cyclase (GGDEF)-like protein